MPRPADLSVDLAAANDDNVCVSQTPSGSGSLTMNGADVSGGIATLDAGGYPRQVIATFAGNEATVPFFYTITDISVDKAANGAIEVGTSAVGASNAFPVDWRQSKVGLGLFFDVTGTTSFTLQYTGDDVFNGSVTPLWFSDGTILNKTADFMGTATQPCTAIKILINSGTGSVDARIVQQTGY